MQAYFAAFAMQRLVQEQSKSHLEKSVGPEGVIEIRSDLKTITTGFMYCGLIMAGYGKLPLLETLLVFLILQAGLAYFDHCFPAKDNPMYCLEYFLGVGVLSMSIMSSLLYYFLCMMDNKKREAKCMKLVL